MDGDGVAGFVLGFESLAERGYVYGNSRKIKGLIYNVAQEPPIVIRESGECFLHHTPGE